MTVRVPATLEELQHNLGEAITVYFLGNYGQQAHVGTYLREATSREDYIPAAKRWCRRHRQRLRAIAEMARRAQCHADPHLCLRNDLCHNFRGVATFLRTVKPSYFGTLFQEGIEQEGQPLMNFLTILQQLA